ncbi:hypothetical protein EDD85DRAFT_786720 [Armillaria nabsnona]|nr:hypothetical protein EDD85DRAFT_786720 [Armillaria nabsnona]
MSTISAIQGASSNGRTHSTRAEDVGARVSLTGSATEDTAHPVGADKAVEEIAAEEDSRAADFDWSPSNAAHKSDLPLVWRAQRTEDVAMDLQYDEFSERQDKSTDLSKMKAWVRQM